MPNSYNIYEGNGVTTAYAVTFEFDTPNQLLVYVGGVQYLSGYTYNSVTKQIVFEVAPISGATVLIQRSTNLDLLYMFGQDAAFTGSNLDANFKRLLWGGQESSDTADRVGKLSLRVPSSEGSVGVLPGITDREGLLLGFAAGSGAPVCVLPESGSASDVLLQLAGTRGYTHIGTCPDMATLRTLEFSGSGTQVYLQEHTAGAGGGGFFMLTNIEPTTDTVDDNGFQIVTDHGQVLHRVVRDHMCSDMFGAVGGEDITPVLDNMYKASRTFRIHNAYLNPPANGVDYLGTGGSVFDVSDGIGFHIVGTEDASKGVAINHTGNNIFVTFKNPQATTTSFYEQASITGVLIRGRNSDNTASGNPGFAVRASDLKGFRCDIFVTGYTSTTGGALSIYNDQGYTELSKLKLTVRGCCNGIVFHRNTTSGTSTNSFMGTEIELDYQAGVTGAANKGINVSNLGGGTTSDTFDLNLYASTIRIKYWAEAGATTQGIYVGAKGIIPESTEVKFVSDGYGFGTSETDTNTAAATNLIRVENGGIFRARCIDMSMQAGTSHRINQLQRLRNTIFSYQDDTYKVPYTDARPYIDPKGMSIRCSGTLSVATQVAGASWQISGLPMGMHLRVSVRQYTETEDTTSVEEIWEVLVRGDNQSVICVPICTTDILTTTTGTAVVNNNFDLATFLKSVSSGIGRFWRGTSTSTRLTVRNNNTDNSLTTGASDGRKFTLYLPPNASASGVLHYTVIVEVV